MFNVQTAWPGQNGFLTEQVLTAVNKVTKKRSKRKTRRAGVDELLLEKIQRLQQVLRMDHPVGWRAVDNLAR